MPDAPWTAWHPVSAKNSQGWHGNRHLLEGMKEDFFFLYALFLFLLDISMDSPFTPHLKIVTSLIPLAFLCSSVFRFFLWPLVQKRNLPCRCPI